MSWNHYGFRPYVSVAERRRKAAKEMAKLAKKGKTIRPVQIEGRTIARTFWGKAWCDNLESYMDYANPLPRGRTYGRNGSVVHLDIRPGEIEATVSGSELYQVRIGITPAAKAKWKSLCHDCSGAIGSLVELLRGRFSDHVMGTITRKETGLFPAPAEITLKCSCPDWATMCKHVAAVLYGVGARLDQNPELLFPNWPRVRSARCLALSWIRGRHRRHSRRPPRHLPRVGAKPASPLRASAARRPSGKSACKRFWRHTVLQMAGGPK